MFKQALEERKQQGLLRKMRLVESSQDASIIIEGKEVINLCSNNYLGLTNDPRLKEASIEAVRKYGTGSGASRLVCGNMYLHQQLEEKIAQFKNCPAALVFNSGYCANLGVISAIMGREAMVFSDRLNHASIVDGIILSKANFKRYPHKDISGLQELLSANNQVKTKLIVTDTVFSMDGDIATLAEIVESADKFNALTMVDEAHATGVFGKNGAGLVEHLGLEGKIDIQMGTLSKAVGSFGAFVCGSKDLIDYLINFSRAFIYTTSLPPALCAASLKAIEIIENEPQRRERLWENIAFFKKGMGDLGFDTLGTASAIIPVLTRDAALTMEFSRRLFEEGILIQGIRPPTVARNESRLRITVTSEHSLKQLEMALGKLEKIGRELCLL